MSAFIGLLLSVAWAQAPFPAPPPVDTPSTSDPVETPAVDTSAEDEVNEDGELVVRIYGPDAIREARRAVVDEMARQGWRQTNTQDGNLVFRGPSAWMGKAVLDREGFMTFSVPAVVFQSAQTAGTDVARQGPTDQSTLARESQGGDFQSTSRDPGSGAGAGPSFSLFPSKRKTSGVHDTLQDVLEPQIAAYRAAIQETAFQETLSRLPDRLDALFWHGVPLDGHTERIEDAAARRRVALSYWATRADTPQGLDVCRAVEMWLEEVVMSSDQPVTLAEQASANATAREHHGRTLNLVRP